MKNFRGYVVAAGRHRLHIKIRRGLAGNGMKGVMPYDASLGISYGNDDAIFVDRDGRRRAHGYLSLNSFGTARVQDTIGRIEQ